MATQTAGVINGRHIDLDQATEFKQGTRIEVLISEQVSSRKSRLDQLRELSGVWKDDESIVEAFAQVASDRQLISNREVPFHAAP